MTVKRGRKPGYSPDKIGLILRVLAQNPDGLWLRKLAEKAGMHPSTVSRYVDNVLGSMIEDVSLGDEKPIMRVIRLKPFVLQKLEEGMDIRKIMKILSVMKNIE